MHNVHWPHGHYLLAAHRAGPTLSKMDLPSSAGSSIKRIDKGTVHNICSGQVIVSLRSAVKELVENALDAGATSVEVHLRDHGTASIEVVDNGAGIHEDDFEAVGLKHHTSKLREFADLPGVSTFGFRGEALGSLCALADVAVVTRHRAAAVGHRLRFSADGRIAERTPVPRQVGTTVTVRDLFAPLPVRRRQFCGRARRELTDLLHTLWGYGLVTAGVRLVCSHQTADGRRSVLLTSSVSAALADRVTALFGQKQLASLVPLVSTVPTDATRQEFGLAAADRAADVTVKGLISSCEHGKGRSASDRQFVFINGRPCDHTKIARLVNEVYRTHNRHQSPFFVLDVTLARERVDVNVTPDKRMMFVQNEKYLLASIKETLTKCFEGLPSSYTVASHLQSQSPASPSVTSPQPLTSPTLAGAWISAIKRSIKKCDKPASPVKRQCLDRFFTRITASPASDGDADFRPATDAESASPRLTRHPPPSDSCSASGGTMMTAAPVSAPAPGLASCLPLWEAQAAGDSTACCLTNSALLPAAPAASQAAPSPAGGDGPPSEGSCLVADGVTSPTAVAAKEDRAGAGGAPESWTVPSGGAEGVGRDTRTCLDGTRGQAQVARGRRWRERGRGVGGAPKRRSRKSRRTGGGGGSPPRQLPPAGGRVSCSPGAVITDSSEGDTMANARKRTRLAFSMDELRRQVATLETPCSEAGDAGREWRFRATIQPSENSAAEQELKLQIKKEDFLEMEVLGQFNLGFLVTRLGEDLFLIDQHASDEKFNFERLSRQPLAKQPLVVPQELELPAVSEETLLSRPEPFAEAGFQVSVDESAPPGRRLRLLAAPAVQGVVCGRADLEELIWLVQESPGPLTAIRPSRVRAVLASRACRTSVMIGTALSPAGMTRLVRNMADMEQPWNCPHGRPTMRHLVCLSLLRS
ncbi:mismatch repair endonuclease PMS2-like [Pollicipes pollicipes]|uniref:mismatch repair endonuclease PMS2-like n=1 Tax=Pollicipes pollicipes TaxID=41117 RepID=UPI001884F8C4|nr:mismatch repair endonuclease PMS2-like [Pollicipes pollicipes]